MVEETFRALADRRVMEVYRGTGDQIAAAGTYSEVYIQNTAVARFVETKFHDNMLHLVQGLQPNEIKELGQVTIDRLWGILPKPVLGVLGVSLNKEVEQAFSMGDFFDYLKHGNEVGGFKTGSVFGHGLALFPIAFPFIYFLMCLVLYLIWDMQSRRGADGIVQLSPVVMLYSYRLFTYGITGESLTSVASLALRSVWQNIALYLIIYWCSRLFFKPFDRTGMSNKAGTVVARRRT